MLTVAGEPPLPPVELRRLVCFDDALFALPAQGQLVFDAVAPEEYRAVFDFGCGCGRIARQLLAQDPRPGHYVGVDIHKGMVAWCQEHLTARDPAFRFFHHDVWNLGLGPDNSRQATAPFPAGSNEFSLVVAHSVFTHLYSAQAEYYLGEIARILTEDGIARTTWFLFDRASFPMLFDFQVNLFVNEIDPTNAVIYDWRWLLDAFQRTGLRVVKTVPPQVKGDQWELYLRRNPGGAHHCFPDDPASAAMMCGTSARTDTAEPAFAAPAGLPAGGAAALTGPPTVPRRVLRYSGTATEAEFQARCAEIPFWYHSYYFDNGLEIRGDYDIGADVAGYGFPESMEGMRVLDIGTGAGWFAHYFEELGAEVVTVDARGYADFDVYGRGSSAREEDGRPPDRVNEDGTPIYFSPVSRGFWIMKEILGSRVQFRNARAYEICPAMFGGRKFDLVFLGALLCHLRDPIGALMAARSVCAHRVIASTPVVLGEPEADVLPRQYLPYSSVDTISWWLPNEACFRHWFLAAGFSDVDISRQVNLTCDIPRVENGVAANGDQIIRVGSAFVPA